MKTILIFSFIIMSFAANTLGQPLCNIKKIITPVVFKPTGDSIISATCTTLTVAWQGRANQTYIAGLTFKNLFTGKTDSIAASAISCDDNLFCTATIPVVAKTSVNWSVQAVQVINGRTFYSYPLAGAKDFMIPGCTVPLAAVMKKNVLTAW